jgi:hypothetical protein
VGLASPGTLLAAAVIDGRVEARVGLMMNETREVAAERGPLVVRRAFWLWVLAVVAGAVETVFVVGSGDAGSGGEVVVGVLVRCLAYGVVLGLAMLMLRGKRWARIVLALGVGILGTLSLVMEPIEWVLDGNSVSGLLERADFAWWGTAVSRAVHVIAVWGGVVLMFMPAANRYFRK